MFLLVDLHVMLVILSLPLIYVKIVINLRFHKSVKREPNNYRETESKNNKKIFDKIRNLQDVIDDS